jgi:hypothetical protein
MVAGQRRLCLRVPNEGQIQEEGGMVKKTS